MLSKMDNLLPDLATFTVGANGLVVGAVLFSVPLNLDRSYVDGGSSCVVSILILQTLIIPFGASTLLFEVGGMQLVASRISASSRSRERFRNAGFRLLETTARRILRSLLR